MICIKIFILVFAIAGFNLFKPNVMSDLQSGLFQNAFVRPEYDDVMLACCHDVHEG